MLLQCRSQWPRGLRRRSAAARLLRLWVRIPPGPWMFVCCECCVLSGRGLCDELIARPEESYPTVIRRCVWSINFVNEEAMGRVGPQRHEGRGGLQLKCLAEDTCLFFFIMHQFYTHSKWMLRYCYKFYGFPRLCHFFLLPSAISYLSQPWLL